MKKKSKGFRISASCLESALKTKLSNGSLSKGKVKRYEQVKKSSKWLS
jgi:hypothetical protein